MDHFLREHFISIYQYILYREFNLFKSFHICVHHCNTDYIFRFSMNLRIPYENIVLLHIFPYNIIERMQSMLQQRKIYITATYFNHLKYVTHMHSLLEIFLSKSTRSNREKKPCCFKTSMESAQIDVIWL
jgi:hypothetical protein